MQQDVGSGSGSSDVPSDGGSSNGSAQGATLYAVHPIPLSDVRAIHKHTPPLGQHRITLTLATGVSLPSLYFQNVRRQLGQHEVGVPCCCVFVRRSNCCCL